MDILVTGGCGFIGTSLVNHLLKQPEVRKIRTFDNYVTGLPRRVKSSRVMEIDGDLRNFEEVLKASEGVASIVHLGALPSVPRSIKDPYSTNDVNVGGTLNVLEAARANGVQHVSVASSSSVYGANPTLPKVETLATLPLSPYAVSKLATEAYTNAYSTSYGLSTVAFRFFNVFGPLQRADHVYAAVIPKFLAAIKNDEPLVIYGDGEQSRDFTSVHAVTDALTKAATRSVTSQSPVNLAFGDRISLNQVVALLQELHPKQLRVEHVEPRTGDVKHSQASSELLTRILPDIERPEFVDALKEVYDWYMAL